MSNPAHTVLAVIFAALASVACGDTFGNTADWADGEAFPGGGLVVLGSPSIVVAPRGAADIRVAYFDAAGAPVADTVVEFALEGDAPAVSLSSGEERSNLDGEASVRLTAGSDSASFRLRANAAGAEPVYVDVRVLESAVRKAMVVALYDGLRALATRGVGALPGVGCEAALEIGMQGEPTASYEGPSGSVSLDLGPGLHYAFVGSGRDATGALLAEGCAEIDVPADGRVSILPVAIELRDRPLTLTGSYEVMLGLDVAASAARAAETSMRGGLALLSGTQTQGADFFLEAIDASARQAMRITQADDLLATRGALAASLEVKLGEEQAGPVPFLSSLAALIDYHGSALAFDAAYGVTSVAGVPMSFALTAMESRALRVGDAALTYDVLSLPAANIAAQYDDARAVIAVETLSVQLGLGTYAGRLLDALEARDGALTGQLRDWSGCDELVAWASDREVVRKACDAGCVRGACGIAIQMLQTQARAALAGLDAAHPSIGVRGELLVFDRDEDGIVDEIGPATFEGSWGQAPEASKADTVDADFAVTSVLVAPSTGP